MTTHSSTIAWKIPWTEEPARLQSMESQSQTRLSDFTFTFTFLFYLTILTKNVYMHINFSKYGLK